MRVIMPTPPGGNGRHLAKRLTVLGLALALGGAGLPDGSVVDPPADHFPAQRLRSEIEGGRQSFQVALGNTAFSSPLLFGPVARDAGLSCNACHVNGHVNPAFHIPGHSARPGGLDPTGSLFNPDAEDGVENHVDIPSLRGVRFLGPYGHDGRIASLREFTRHVIVEEFAGPEPAPPILDALVAYMQEFEFLPNGRITPLGAPVVDAPAAEQRGAALFGAARGPDGLACADCHRPTTAFTDGQVHDVGTGGRFRTPTLLNAATSAPYGHDGRWPDLAAAARHVPTGLDAGQRADLLAWLEAVTAVDEAEDAATFGREMAELATYVGLLDATLRRHDAATTRFVVDTVRTELRRLQRAFPEGDTALAARRPDRRKRLPLDYPALDAGLDRVAALAEAGDGGAAGALEAYHEMAAAMVANYPRFAR